MSVRPAFSPPNRPSPKPCQGVESDSSGMGKLHHLINVMASNVNSEVSYDRRSLSRIALKEHPVPPPPKSVAISKSEIGRRVQSLRRERGMTQAELATMLDAHVQSVSQIERGVRGLTVQQVVRLARALGVPTDSILGDAKKGAPKSPRINGRLLRHLRRIEELPAAKQKALLEILDGLADRVSSPS